MLTLACVNFLLILRIKKLKLYYEKSLLKFLLSLGFGVFERTNHSGRYCKIDVEAQNAF